MADELRPIESSPAIAALCWLARSAPSVASW